MTDNDLFKLVRPALIAKLLTYGITIGVEQSYKPTNHGANTLPTIYIHKLFDKRYGFVKKSEMWNSLTSVFDHHETQQYETAFQINALAILNPADINSKTASDLVNYAAAAMQSDYMQANLLAAGVGILRVTEIRNPYFVNDLNRFEASPSFDFVLTHKQDLTSTTQEVKSVEYNVARI
jgi:hypothetical protein